MLNNRQAVCVLRVTRWITTARAHIIYVLPALVSCTRPPTIPASERIRLKVDNTVLKLNRSRRTLRLLYRHLGFVNLVIRVAFRKIGTVVRLEEHPLLVLLFLLKGALSVGKFAPFLLLLVDRADLLADDGRQIKVLLDGGHVFTHAPAHLG